MDKNKIAEYTTLYEGMDVGVLLDTIKSYNTLTADAREAIDKVITNRSVELESLKHEIEKESLGNLKEEHAQAKKSDERDKLYYKIFLIIGLPIIVIGALALPDRSYVALVSALTQVLF